MNVNQLIKKMKDELGLSRFLKLSYTDRDIYDIIKNTSLVEWGSFFSLEYQQPPFMLSADLRISPDLYMIPDDISRAIERSELQIIDIRKERFTSNISSISSATIMTMYNQSTISLDTLMNNETLASEYGNVDMHIQAYHSCWYERPNRIRFNFEIVPTSEITASFWLSQATNLSGISPGRELDFYELCKLNTMIVIYNNEAKFIESIQSGLGNINLKLEDWASAKDKKEELLARFREYSVLEKGMQATRVF